MYCIVLYCIAFIHLYSASCSAHQSEALPVRETQREERQSMCHTTFNPVSFGIALSGKGQRSENGLMIAPWGCRSQGSQDIQIKMHEKKCLCFIKINCDFVHKTYDNLFSVHHSIFLNPSSYQIYTTKFAKQRWNDLLIDERLESPDELNQSRGILKMSLDSV